MQKSKEATWPRSNPLASKVLSGQIKKPTPTQVKKLAGSALGQDEKGKRR